MTRNEEYAALLRSLEKTPETLDTTVERALARKRASQKKRRLFGIPAASLAACFAGFILLVNLFPPFAHACGGVPVLRELAKAVAWSPSLSAAVEHDYVQPIEQSQTENGVTATVHYVIVDRKKVSIFYSLDYDTAVAQQMAVDSDLLDMDGWAGSAGGYIEAPGELQEIDIDFVEQDMPPTLELSMKVAAVLPDVENFTSIEDSEDIYDDFFHAPERKEPDYIAEFVFSLEFDPYYAAQGEIISVNQTFTLDGQTFTLTEVELYPTHLRVKLDDDAGNTAWLNGLELYLENEHGDRFESSTNGITASGDPDGEGMASFWLDSPWFSQGEHLTLHITQARWKDKDAPRVRLDLANGTAENLPEGVEFLRAERHEDGWMVFFVNELYKEKTMYSLFSGSFYDEDGREYWITDFGSSYGYEDPVTGETVESDTVFTEAVALADFHGDVVYLEPSFDRTSAFDPPVSVVIK